MFTRLQLPNADCRLATWGTDQLAIANRQSAISKVARLDIFS